SYSSTSLEKCVNGIITSRSLNDENIYLINTDIRLSRPAIYYDIAYELRLFNQKPTFYIISGNITKILHKLYMFDRLNNNASVIIINEAFNTNIFQLLEYYFLSKAIILTDNTNGNTIKNKPNLHGTNLRPSHSAFNTTCYDNNIYLTETSHLVFQKLKALHPFAPPYVFNRTSGIFTSIINIIAERLKIKVQYYASNVSLASHRLDPQFLTRNFDLFVGPVYMAVTETYYFSKSIFITYDPPIYVFPRIQRRNIFKIICKEFSLLVWLWFLSLFALLYFMFFIFERLTFSESKISSTYILLLSILLEGTAPVRIKNISLKILFTTFLIFTIIFSTLYKAKMFDIMKEGFSYNLYNSKEDILKYRLEVGLRDISFAEIYRLSTSSFERAIYHNHLFVECGEYKNCLNRTATQKNLVTAMILRYLQYLLPKYFLDDEGKSQFHVIYLPFSPLYFGLAFLKDHPQIHSFNRYLLLLKERGFVDYFQREYEWKYQAAMALPSNTKGAISKSLSLKSFETVFLLYFMGIIISFISFLTELIVQKAKKATAM
ncbi:Ionotropic receptor 148, partial [Diabrotica virgifera virgifera]